MTGTPNDDLPDYYAVSLTRDLLPDDIDRVPDVPFLILLSDLKDMRLQIPNVLSAQTERKKENISAGAEVFVRDMPPRA